MCPVYVVAGGQELNMGLVTLYGAKDGAQSTIASAVFRENQVESLQQYVKVALA
jgi:hypothetical protein